MRVIHCMKCNRRMRPLVGTLYRCDPCNLELNTRPARRNVHISQISYEATQRYPLRVDDAPEAWSEA